MTPQVVLRSPHDAFGPWMRRTVGVVVSCDVAVSEPERVPDLMYIYASFVRIGKAACRCDVSLVVPKICAFENTWAAESEFSISSNIWAAREVSPGQVHVPSRKVGRGLGVADI